MAVSSAKWLLYGGLLAATLAAIGAPEAWAEGIRASDAVDAINSGRQQFLQGLRGALAAVAAQKENLVEELLTDVEEEEEKEEEEMEKELEALDPPNVKTLDIRLPDAQISTDNERVCMATSLTDAQQHIVGFSPLIIREDVKHIALYGCPDQAASKRDYWSCNPQNNSGICQGPTALMYEWTRDRCDDYLAKGEAIAVGGAFIHNVVLMVQYADGGFKDSSGLQLKLMPSTTNDEGVIETVQYYSASLKNPSCDLDLTSDSKSVETDEVPVGMTSSSSVAVEEQFGSDGSVASSLLQSILEANVDWLSSSEPRIDYGADGSIPVSYLDNRDEYYADEDDSFMNQIGEDSYMDNTLDETSVYGSSVDWMTRLQDLWNSAGAQAYGMVLRGWWPRNDARDVGQVAGVATDSSGKLFLIHRGERRWEDRDFDDKDKFLLDDPISEDVILTLDPGNGKVISSWGSDRFYMPHGLYIDTYDNIWVTDVALHQVLKFPAGYREPSLVLGEAFVPGKDLTHFCKPTDVAVDRRTGEFYVADGYCNSRVLKFSANGTVLMEITAGNIAGDVTPAWSPLSSFRIPHSLVLIESRDIICVADRENARIQCFNLTNGIIERQIASPLFGEQIFAIAYDNDEDVLYAVNGPNEALGSPPLAFTVDLETGEILSTWDPYPNAFGVVHDIATYSPDGAVYVADIGLDRVWKFETTSSSLENEI